MPTASLPVRDRTAVGPSPASRYPGALPPEPPGHRSQRGRGLGGGARAGGGCGGSRGVGPSGQSSLRTMPHERTGRLRKLHHPARPHGLHRECRPTGGTDPPLSPLMRKTSSAGPVSKPRPDPPAEPHGRRISSMRRPTTKAAKQLHEHQEHDVERVAPLALLLAVPPTGSLTPMHHDPARTLTS